MLVVQSCLTLWNPIDYSPPGSSVHGVLQARILEGLSFPSPGDLPDPAIEPGLPHCRQILCLWNTREALWTTRLPRSPGNSPFAVKNSSLLPSLPSSLKDCWKRIHLTSYWAGGVIQGQRSILWKLSKLAFFQIMTCISKSLSSSFPVIHNYNVTSSFYSV